MNENTQADTSTVEQTKVVKIKKRAGRKVDPNSKLSIAGRLYANAVDKSRQSIIKLFQEDDSLRLEKSIAQAYYGLLNKKAKDVSTNSGVKGSTAATVVNSTSVTASV